MTAIKGKTSEAITYNLAADSRLSATNYPDDHIWELRLGGREPPSLAIQTTFGLRARSFRVFPRFILQDSIRSDPATFEQPVTVKSANGHSHILIL